MEKGISKPNIVKGIPLALIRPLPSFYYFGQYTKNSHSGPVYDYFQSSINYLNESLKIVNDEVKSEECASISNNVLALKNLNSTELLNATTHITSQLSSICQLNKEKIRDNPRLSKEIFSKLYKDCVSVPNLLIVDNNHEPDRANHLSDTFETTCFYNTRVVSGGIDSSLHQLDESDFIIFTSAYPLSVNEDVKNIESYKKPCIVLANLKKEAGFDQQTMRNGSWLQSRGYEVLYKIFTPLRLFTSVDKIYMKYHLT